MHDAYPASNIRPLCTYWGWSSILTVLLITFPSTINWEKVSIPYLQEESKSISHFQLIEAPLDWLESTFKILPILLRISTWPPKQGFNPEARKGPGWRGVDNAICGIYSCHIYVSGILFFHLFSKHKTKMLNQAWSQLQLTMDPGYTCWQHRVS